MSDFQTDFQLTKKDVSMIYNGSCLCGEVEYACEVAPITTAICHCTDCQKQSGSAFSVNLLVPAPAFRASGDHLKCFKTTGHSGAVVRRFFCGNCGSAVYSEFAAIPGLLAIKAGTLSDPTAVAPELELWCASAQQWTLNDRLLPRFDQASSD